MMKNIKIGDILSVERGIVVHGCNAQGIMGSGIALKIKTKWPKCYEIYRDFCDGENDKSKLLGSVVPYAVTGRELVIINAITQLDFCKDGKKYVSYEAVLEAFKMIAESAKFSQLPVHYPLIGAGLGGGEWSIISEIIDFAFKDYANIDRTLWIYE